MIKYFVLDIELSVSESTLCTIFVFLLPYSTIFIMLRILKLIAALFFVFCFLFSPVVDQAKSLSFLPEDPEQKAVSLFNDGKYDEALPYFEDLHQLYPDDKVLNYYFGACMIETGHYGTDASRALLASEGKDIPQKLNWYLGVAFHAENDFVTALDYYTRFEKEAKGKLQKEVDLDNVIDLCEKGVNPFVKTEQTEESPAVSESIPKEVVSVQKTDTSEVGEPIPSLTENSEIIAPALYDSVISFQVNPEIMYMKLSQFKVEGAKSKFVEGWMKKMEMDSIEKYTDGLRKKYTQSDEESRRLLADQIISNEQLIITDNSEMTNLNIDAHQIEAAYWEHASSEEADLIIQQNKELVDSLKQLITEKKDEINQMPPETVIVPVIEKKEKEEVDPATVGVVYKIQLGAYRQDPPDWVKRLYKKLSIIRKISNYTDANGVTVYTTGELRSYNDAVEMLKQVKEEGVKDAVMAAYKDGARIKISEARKINGE